MAEGELEPGERFAWADLREEARRRFGVTRFRPGQRELIETVMSGENALGILPTGAGKSLCFQLPALFLKGAVVVVSPLIALMQDQQDRLEEASIESARLDSTVPKAAQAQQEIEVRKGAYDIVLVTPERLQNPMNREPLRNRSVALFVVDEAHCISQWGHDFRPAYLELKQVIDELGRPPVLALTATAPPDLIDDIRARLGINGARVIQTGVERKNLFLETRRTVNREEKEHALLEIIGRYAGSGIVYVATIKRVEEIHSWLRTRDVPCERYHGQLSKREREEAQDRFMRGESPLMIATNAFGLGIDKPDVRFVVHWNFPGSVESYYQEAGRAGRDGESALASAEEGAAFTNAELARASGLSARRVAVLVAGLKDLDVLTSVRRRVSLRRPLRASELEQFIGGFESQRAAEAERLRAMMKYGELASCRMRYLRQYFGEPQGEDCGHCDNCEQPPTERSSPATHPRAAPRALSTAERKSALAAGQRVSHKTFGAGEVVCVEDDQVVVKFARDGERRIIASHLRRAGPRRKGLRNRP